MPRMAPPLIEKRPCRHCGASFFIQHIARHERGHESFWTQVDKSGECWMWTGPVTDYGYGICNRAQEQYAHRLAYRWLVGPIPEGFEVDHLCRMKLCVNPAHLEPVTKQENIRRQNALTSGKAQRARTHCPQGHPYSGTNLHVRRNGHRTCVTCSRQRVRDSRAAQRQAAA